uniref:Putative rasgap sh3 binding protein rasputin n=1 Tax=Ixodes ricinus TaxID=34613 RepID=V5HCT0_IXORI
MVMETPTALCIGREFVRQYYTVLNQSPLHLHRFYSQDSSFVHGGPEKQPCVTGQHDIHRRIMQLNFRDCHAKIRQVDSHSTLGQGVVVQVTGELSNGGQPMRRFMQTFVLAPQSPLKYYVRNDIFRYQDEVFTEEEEEEDPQPGEMGHQQVAGKEGTPVSPATPSDPSGAGVPVTQEAAVPGDVGNGANPASPSAGAGTGPTANAYYEQQEVVRNGTSHLVSESDLSSQGSGPADSLQGSPPEASQAGGNPPVSAPLGWKEEESARPAPVSAPQVNHQAPVETKTYANMVSKNQTPLSSTGFTCLTPAPFGGGAPTSHAPATSHAPSTPSGRFGGEPLPPRGGDQRGPRPQQSRPQTRPMAPLMPRRPDREVSSAPRGDGPPLGGGDDSVGSLGSVGPRPGGGAKPQYPDVQQVFVGNLPHSITEDQVRERFEEFGRVLEFRINPKPSSKMTSGGKTVPNCGFVIFDSAEAAQAVLKKHAHPHQRHPGERGGEEDEAEAGHGEPAPLPPLGAGLPEEAESCRGVGPVGAGANGRGGAFPRGNRPGGLGLRH